MATRASRVAALVLVLRFDAAAAAAGSLPALVATCATPPVAAQAFTINGGGIGVISSHAGAGCLCAAGDTPAPLTFFTCEGSGTTHELEIDFAFNGTASATIPWASSGLCVTAGAAAGAPVTLSPCAASPPPTQIWRYEPATAQLVSAAGLCLVVPAPPPPPPSLLSNVFGSAMVLQRGAPARLWGFTTPGASVVVAASDAAANVTSPPADANGRWEVELPPRPAGSGVNITCFGPNGTMTTITNVAFGDVYWCSGQSNLSGGNTPVNYAFNGTHEANASSAFPWLRVMAAQMVGGSAVPLPELAAAPRIPWSVAGPASVGRFSATCYFAGKALAETLGPAVPIGLIESAWGGTSIQPWLPPAAVPVCGDPPAFPGGWPQKTSCLWNSQTVPFSGMRVSGIIWYQGGRLRTLPPNRPTQTKAATLPPPLPPQASPMQ
jgi:hypothetical protein